MKRGPSYPVVFNATFCLMVPLAQLLSHDELCLKIHYGVKLFLRLLSFFLADQRVKCTVMWLRYSRHIQ